MLHRIGSFFILVGLALFVIFIGSIMGKDTNLIYLVLCLAAWFVAFLLRRNKPAQDSGRFRMIRRAGERSRQRREERMSRERKK
jgi:hypothetical protein